MAEDKDTAPEKDITPPEEVTEDTPVTTSEETNAPADALSRTPDDLKQEEATKEAAAKAADPNSGVPEEKKLSPAKKLFRKINLYFLIFVILVIVAGVFTVVSYLNSQKAPEEPNIATQQLDEDTLKELANSDATVGNTSQTLTIQGNAIIAGQTLMRGNLNVAGNFQTGGTIQGPSITISGSANLGDVQMNTLQVASNAAIQGNTTLRDLSVSGASTFNGVMTASEINVTRLILTGNATLQVPNHISFTGPTPERTVNGSVVGVGGSISVSGSDTAGTINVNTGNNPTPGCFGRINFRQAFPKQPHVIVSPIGSAAGQTQFYTERNTTGFNICTANAAPANQSFSYDFFITY